LICAEREIYPVNAEDNLAQNQQSVVTVANIPYRWK
jgi:hypothetical protein